MTKQPKTTERLKKLEEQMKLILDMQGVKEDKETWVDKYSSKFEYWVRNINIPYLYYLRKLFILGFFGYFISICMTIPQGQYFACGIMLIFVAAIIFLERYEVLKKIGHFLQDSMLMLIIIYDISDYCIKWIKSILIRFEYINIQPDKLSETNIDIILFAWLFSILLTNRPSILMIKGYMMIQHTKWRFYEPSIFRIPVVFAVTTLLFYMKYIEMSHNVELEKSIINAIIESLLLIISFAFIFLDLLISDYKCSKKYKEKILQAEM